MLNENFAFARQLVLNEPDRKKVEEGGEFTTAGGNRARWSVEISSTNVADVFRVAFTCEVSDPARSEPDRVTQGFLLMRPTWVIDAATRETRVFRSARERRAGRDDGACSGREAAAAAATRDGVRVVHGVSSNY